MKELHFDFRDLFRAPRIALSLQRIWINGLGLLVAYLFYLIISYLSLAISGYNLSDIWFQYGLLPCAFSKDLPWYGSVVNYLGILITIAIIFMTNIAVSRVVYMTLRDELFYTWSQGFKFAIHKWVSILGAYLTLIFMIAFMIVAAIVIGFIGRIPFVGEIGTALFTVPFIFGAILLLFTIIVFGAGIFFIPAIIAVSDEDALGGVFQSFSITFNQWWRLIIYGAIVAILEIAAFVILAGVIKISFLTFTTIFSWGMGDKILEFSHYSLHLFDQSVPAMFGWMHALPAHLGDWIYLTDHHLPLGSISAGNTIAAYIMTIFLLFISGAVLAYGEATGNAGLVLTYIIIFKKHEGESLLEREDEELKEDEAEEENSVKQENEQNSSDPAEEIKE